MNTLSSQELAQQRQLRRYKAVPLVLLVLMLISYLALGTIEQPGAWVPWARAFAEAGLVGALADWFAVVALFRHPMGIPIPHTAIIAQRKDELAQALARFIDAYFLTRESIQRRVAVLAPGRRLLAWLQERRSATQVAQSSLIAARWLLEATGEREVERFLNREFREVITAKRITPLFAGVLRDLEQGGLHQPLLTELAQTLADTLRSQHELLLEQFRDGAPWWLPASVDRRLFNAVLIRAEAVLEEVVADDEHPLRERINTEMRALAERLADGEEGTIDAWQQRIDSALADSALNEWLHGVWRALRVEFLALIEREQEAGEDTAIAAYIQQLAARAANDEALCARLDDGIAVLGAWVVDNHSDEITRVISETVQHWDGKATSRRIELHVGKDLQFIRINGTLVGGAIGVLLYAIDHWMLNGGAV